jgi:hypothetical protein
VLRDRALQDPDPELTLAAGDRMSLPAPLTLTTQNGADTHAVQLAATAGADQEAIIGAPGTGRHPSRQLGLDGRAQILQFQTPWSSVHRRLDELPPPSGLV